MNSSDTRRFTRTQDAYRENDPPVEVNQIWSAPGNDGEIFRRVRILAPYPDPDKNGGRLWITQDAPSKFLKNRTERPLNISPEFNLRYVFTLEGMYEQ